MVLSYFTVQDTIVQNAIKTLSQVDCKDKSNSPILVGGIAVQLHSLDVPSSTNLLRPTCDLDLLYMPDIDSYVDFERGIGGCFSKILKKEGYQIQLKKIKNRPQYEVKIMNGQGLKAKELFFIHFDKLGYELNAKTRFVSERESTNALEHEYNGGYILLKRMEDIIPHKIKRVRKGIVGGFNVSPLEKALHKTAEQGDWASLANHTNLLSAWLDNILIQQNNLLLSDNHTPPREYTITKDLYDICLLARKIEGTHGAFNKAYYLNSKFEVDSI
jgi:hypothetical protein